MKQDISDQKQIYVDYYTINKSANKGYHKRCTLEFHSSYDIILFENLFKPRQRRLAVYMLLTSSVLSTTSKQCFEQPAASFLVCSLIFIEYKLVLLYHISLVSKKVQAATFSPKILGYFLTLWYNR